jgi:hypothetical protein
MWNLECASLSRTVVLAAIFCVGAATAADEPKKSPGPASRALTALEARGVDDLVYPFVLVPRRIALTEEQVDQVRSAALQQVLDFHEFNAQRNRISSADLKVEAANRLRSREHDEWSRQHTQKVLAAQQRSNQLIFYSVLAIVGFALLLTVYQFLKDSALAERAAMAILGANGNSKRVNASAQTKRIGDGEQEVEGHRKVLDVRRLSIPGQGPSAQPISEETLASIAELAASHPESKEVMLEVLKIVKAQHNVTVGPTGIQIGSQVVGLVILAFSLAFFYLYLETVYPVSMQQLSVSGTPTSK